MGNILENALAACQRSQEKFIRLSILTEKNTYLYISNVNFFDGIVRVSNGRYLSTRQSHDATI